VDIVLIVILLISGAVIGWYDTFSVQRTYADVYASRHGHIPPLISWFIAPDPDVEVEYWRRRHRNLYVLVSALGAAVIVLALLRLRG
jgi:hypothetical protein